MIGATVLCAACAGTLREGVRVGDEGVYFRVRQPRARAVAVAGDFNGWSPDTHPMMRSGDFWTSVIALSPGDHVFMYVVDGSWVTPPHATDVVPDGFGAFNGKVTVP